MFLQYFEDSNLSTLLYELQNHVKPIGVKCLTNKLDKPKKYNRKQTASNYKNYLKSDEISMN